MTKTEIFFHTLNFKNISKKSYENNENIVIDKVKMNSEDVERGDLFLAIRGGNDYIFQALEKGAYVVYDKKEKIIDEKYGDRVFLVNDTVLFLQKFSENWRKNLKIKVIGITGSNGKTTVKDMIFNVLKTKLKGKKTEGNLNNHIGLPFTLLRSEEDDDFIILEMGMSNLGEINLLGEISKPDIGVITNIGESHLEYLKNKENVMKAKYELIPHVKDFLIVNGDDEYLKNIDKYVNDNFNGETSFEIIKILDGEKNKFFEQSKNFYYDNILFNERGSKSNLEYYGRRCKLNVKREFETNVIGKHNVLNLTMALAVGKILFLEDKYLIEAVKKLELTDMRFQKIEKDNKIFINDAYNASPLSMEKSLETFSNLYNERVKVVVLGDMLELGEDEIFYHENISKVICNINVNKVYLYGKRMKFLYDKLVVKKLDEKVFDELEYFEKKDLISKKIEELSGELVVLIKGSRGMRLEEIIK